MKRNTMMLTLVAGLLLCGSQAFGLPLLAEDFNDVTGIGTTQRTIQNILATTPGELPSGTSWAATIPWRSMFTAVPGAISVGKTPLRILLWKASGPIQCNRRRTPPRKDSGDCPP